ncbi:MAG: hypothetical protein R3F19_13505 [Verrucomicrobiales bacterium]|nr:hypothetical protein [Verrucomicrobiae bacterium]
MKKGTNMNTKIKTLIVAGVTLLTLPLTSVNTEAKERGHRYSDSYRRGGGDSCRVDYDRGRSRSHHRSSYSTTCRPIHSCYFTRGCDRYKKTTYLHTKTDCYGRVVSCWKTERTTFAGHAHRY